MSMFKPSALLGKAFRAAAKAAKFILNRDGVRKPILLSEANFTAKEKELVIDELHVKRKLGKSFFRKRLSARTRQRRLASLTCAEARIARAHRWIL